MPTDAVKYDSNYYSPYGYWRVTDVDSGELIGYYQGNFDFIAFQLRMTDKVLMFQKIDFKNYDMGRDDDLPEVVNIRLVYDNGFFVSVDAANKILEGRPQVNAEEGGNYNLKLVRQLSKKEKAKKVIENLTGDLTENDKKALKEAYKELIRLENDE